MVIGLLPSCSLDVAPYPEPKTAGKTGLDIDIVNGTSAGFELLSGNEFYVQQLRFRVSAKRFPAPEVLDWLETQSEMAVSDWHGTARMATSWERQSNGSYREVRPYLGAAWMRERQTFRLELYDEAGAMLAGPVEVAEEQFVIARKTAIAWVDGEPAEGDYGSNSGSYGSLAVTSGGAFSGALDDIYLIEVVTGGAVDGTAVVDISSVRGDDAAGIAVQNNVAIPLGAAGRGATITFQDAGATTLAAGDRWIVRCTAGDEAEVGAATPGPQASFNAVAEIRMQFPDSRTAETFAIPDAARELRVFWSGRPNVPYVVPISFAPADLDPAPVDYGLDVDLTLSAPANGAVYAPGETIDVAVDLFDRAGNRLHAPGQLPTYRDYITGRSNGIMYYRLGVDPSFGFFTEYRLNLMRLAVYGPKQDVEQNYTAEHTTAFYLEEVNLPDVGTVIFAGLAPGSDAWDTPIANHAEFEIPEDAEPGTYIALAKVARSYRGETIYLEEHVDFQVGTADVTDFDEDVGNCEVCHTGEAHLSRLRHGISVASPKFCEPCHAPPHATPIGAVVHRIHFYSSKYPARKSGCSLCHLEPGSNARASAGVCGACHGEIHPGENMVFDSDPYAQCGEACHKQLPPVHSVLGSE